MRSRVYGIQGRKRLSYVFIAIDSNALTHNEMIHFLCMNLLIENLPRIKSIRMYFIDENDRGEQTKFG